MLKVHRPSELCKICILLFSFYFCKKNKENEKMLLRAHKAADSIAPEQAEPGPYSAKII